MNKKILLTFLVLFTVLLSVSAIQASDVNVTDSYTTNLVDDTSDASVPLENTADSSDISVSSDSNVDNDPSKVSLSSEEVLESEDSNTLSTDSNSNESLNSNNGIAAASSEDGVLSVSSDVSSKIDVSKTIQAKSITKYYKGSTQYTATFLDENGNPLANTNVKITANGVTYTKKTNAQGVASLPINLKPGTYKVVVAGADSKDFTAEEVTSKIVIKKAPAKLTPKKLTAKKGAKKYFKVTVKNKKTKKVIKGVKVKIKVYTGKKAKTFTAKTNAKGIAKILTNKLKVGKHKVVVASADKYVTAKKAKSTIKITK